MVDQPTQTVDRSLLQYHLIQSGTRIALMGIKCGTAVGLALCVYWSIEALAGHVTDAQISIVVKYLTERSSGATVSASLLFGMLGILFGFLQWRLRHRTIQDFAAYREAIEGPRRTSSMLDHYGQTHPRDRE